MKFWLIETTARVSAHDLTGRPVLRQAREFEMEHALEWSEGQGLRIGPLDKKRVHRFVLDWPKLRLWVWLWGGSNGEWWTLKGRRLRADIG